MNDDFEGQSQEGLASQHEAWLRRIGQTDSKLTHNTIVLNLYVQFPIIKFLEYDMSREGMTPKTIDLTLYLGFWRGVFTNKGKLINTIFEMFKEYLPEHRITVRIARWRGQERRVSNEELDYESDSDDDNITPVDLDLTGPKYESNSD